VPADAGALLTVDLDAIAANYRRLCEEAPGAEVASVVKADGYGLGADRVAPALWAAGCRTFIVAIPAEAVPLRATLPKARIAVLNGFDVAAATLFARHRLEPVLNDLAQLDAWRAFNAAQPAPLPAILHVDSGMNRLGLGDRDVAALADAPDRLAGAGIGTLMSHLACSEEPDHPANAQQRAAFAAARARLEPALGSVATSLANSSGVFLGPDFHGDLLRPGAALYGINPRPAHVNPMHQVIQLYGKILQVRVVDRDMTVGYGAAHRVAGGRRLATVAIGYADGYRRALGSRGVAFLRGHRAPVVGRISMDLTTIDISRVPADVARPGAAAELIGPHVDVDAVAAAAGTIGYEILTGLGQRVARRYVGGPA